MRSLKNIVGNLQKYQVLSLTIAFCYFAGYLSFTYHYRLLGLNLTTTPLEYLTLGGDFLISSVIKTIKVPFDYEKDFCANLFWSEFGLITWLLIVAIALKLVNVVWRNKRTDQAIKYFCIPVLILVNILFIKWQSINLDIDNVLSVHPQREYNKFGEKADSNACDLMYEIYKSHINHLQQESPKVYTRVNHWFSLLSTEDLSKNRLVSYSALCFAFVIMLLYYNFVLKATVLNGKVTSLLYLFLTVLIIVNLVFLPVSYGILGRSYQVPYVSLQFKDSSNINQNRMYLIKEDNENYIMYDKMNFFQVKYIPMSRVKEIDQLFVLNPFQSPITNQSSICDSLINIPKQIDY